MNIYKLVATNSQGAKVFFYGNTKKECKDQFNSEYHKKGWTIEIVSLHE